MNKARISLILLIFLLWLTQTGASSKPVQSLAASSPAAPAAPAPFGKQAPDNNTTNQPLNDLALRWGASTAGVTYQYCVRPNKASCPGPKWINAGNALTVKLQGLSPNTTYYWQVRAVDTTGGITYADGGGWWQFRTVVNTNLPGPFTKVSPADEAINQPVNGLALTWSASALATSYQYCYDTVNNNTCDPGTWTNATGLSATINGLSFDTTYYWQVRAVNASGSVQADAATWFSFRTITGAPGVFGKSAPVNFATTQPLALTLSWTAASGTGVSYAYCLSTTPCTAASTWTAVGTNLSAAVSGLQYETTYYWQVRATNTYGSTDADLGSVWSFQTLLAPPAGFNKISPENNAPGQPPEILIRWNPTQGTNVRYEYCFSAAPCGSNSVWEQAGTATSANIVGLAYGTTYYWQVRAVNPSGTTYANGGTVWSLTTHIGPPQPFVKLNPPNLGANVAANVSLQWSASTGAGSYFYCVDPAPHAAGDTTCSTNWTETTATESPHLNLSYNTTYYWQVYAKNSYGQPQANGGTWWSFTTVQTPPSDFTKLSPAGGEANVPLQPTLYWWAPEDATFEWCINTAANCTDNGATWNPIGFNAPINIATPLLRNTQYFWQLRATNTGGTTYANSDTWWSFTTLKNPPTSSNQSFSTPEDTQLSAVLAATSSYGKTFTLYGSQPAGSLVLNANGSFDYTPAANFNGTVMFQFIVSDGYNPPIGPYTATITVNAVNDAPTLAALSAQKVRIGKQVSFWAQATDLDLPYGDQLTYSLDGTLPPGVSIDPNSGFFAWTVLETQRSGDYTFTVRVTDKAGLSATQPVKITVTGMRIYLAVAVK